MPADSDTQRWVSFCISTFKRAGFLAKQLELLLGQSEIAFEIVVSDNDPDASARSVCESYHDDRMRYFHNQHNLGMMKSFNKSIERARTPFVVMVTDDDPVDPSFLASFKQHISRHPGLSMYGGFVRTARAPEQMEIIGREQLLDEILDPAKTTSLLWSSCILNRDDVLEIGGIPEFGSPHLADHALLVMVGSIHGALIVNKMYSQVTFHENNFSKLNFTSYTNGAKGMYNTLSGFITDRGLPKHDHDTLQRHLHRWFISNIFNLKKYYTRKNDKQRLKEIADCAQSILNFPFMRKSRLTYFLKSIVLPVKNQLGLLK